MIDGVILNENGTLYWFQENVTRSVAIGMLVHIWWAYSKEKEQ